MGYQSMRQIQFMQSKKHIKQKNNTFIAVFHLKITVMTVRPSQSIKKNP